MMADTIPGWLLISRRVALLLFAWSLPVSLFGMQAGVILGAVVLLVWSILQRGRNLHKTSLDAAMLALVAAVGLSLLMAQRGPVSFRSATSFWVMGAFYTTWFMLDGETTLRRALWGLFALACAAAVFGAYQSLSGHYPLGHLIHSGREVLLQPVPDMHKTVGASGFFYSRLTLAHVLLFPFCWAVSLLMERFPARRRILLALVAGITAMGMFFTYTRATLLIATVAALALVVWGLRVGWKKKMAAGFAVLCLCAGAIGLAPQLREKLARSFLGSRDWGRLTLWQTALDLASANPLSGVGWGNFHRDARERVEKQVQALKAKRFSARLDWAHNNLLTFLAETGLVGAFALCLLFVLYFRACASRLRKTPKESLFLRGFMRGAMISIAAFLVAGCFHDTMIHAEGVFCCWFAMGASLAAGGFDLKREGAG